MTRTERHLDATPSQIWGVLSDGWLYPLWVVGASRMREVDTSWPRPGASLHHSVGSWPLLVDDTTTVVSSKAGESILLRARARPGGEAEVRITVEREESGCTVVIEEDAVSGPGRLVPKPVRASLLRWRNVETLRRLAYLAERRQKR